MTSGPNLPRTHPMPCDGQPEGRKEASKQAGPWEEWRLLPLPQLSQILRK